MNRSKTNWKHWRIAFGIAIPSLFVGIPVVVVASLRANAKQWELKCMNTVVTTTDTDLFIKATASESCYWCGDYDDWTTIREFTVGWDWYGANAEHTLYFCINKDHSDKTLAWEQKAF